MMAVVAATAVAALLVGYALGWRKGQRVERRRAIIVRRLGRCRIALGHLNAACEDEHINHDPHIGKAIRALQHQRH
jgi:hypothetical protein